MRNLNEKQTGNSRKFFRHVFQKDNLLVQEKLRGQTIVSKTVNFLSSYLALISKLPVFPRKIFLKVVESDFRVSKGTFQSSFFFWKSMIFYFGFRSLTENFRNIHEILALWLLIQHSWYPVECFWGKKF